MKKLIAGMLSAALLVSMTDLTAFAYSEEESQKSETATATGSVPAEESKTAEMDDAIGIVDTESSKLNDDTVGESLTPDGNMTLVDDLGSAADEGQQFITLVTKNGNTFYLVIDRNDVIQFAAIHNAVSSGSDCRCLT